MYLGVFTWNIRTGYVDTLASHTGLELTRWVLTPGRWVWTRLSSFWERYVYFVGVRQENETLREDLARANEELVGAREQASLAKRLTDLLLIAPPPQWTREASRVIAHRLGPNAALETFVIDKGRRSDVDVNTPVVAPEGVVGRVLRASMNAATVLMVTDPNSKIPVVSQKSRTQGILVGRGSGQPMMLQYVSLSAQVEPGEILVTTGLEGIFPQGLPLATVTNVNREGASLFLNVSAQALFDPKRLEEVALLKKAPPPKPEEEEALPDTSTKRPKGAADRKGEVKKRGRNEPPEARPQESTPKKKRGEGQ
ncbi:rod shape-determining protein MreC [Fundidesulfovibrio agrisoli]|uniref:rod shape-determining protein MreC n=1 Tax=Fundidesulfovibrio agrisoli TaxID=2922717 RepID=UPI001FAE4DA4